MKTITLLLSALASTSVFAASDIVVVSCKDAAEKIMVETVIDLETGEENTFTHYGAGSQTDLIVSHVEGEPDAMETEGAMIEVSATNAAQTSTARLTLMLPNADGPETNHFITAGFLEYANDGMKSTARIENLSCEVKPKN